MGIQVRAKQRGFYADNLREVGAEFEIASKKELGRWMEIISEPKDEKPDVKK